ncbi:MAG: radical SAM protein [Desulfoplanes sp.]
MDPSEYLFTSLPMMHTPLKKILLLYTDEYYLVKQVYPFGLDIVASFLRAHGFEVDLDYPFLPGPCLEENLHAILMRTRPDCIGLGIRNIDTTMACETYGTFQGPGFSARYFLPQVKNICTWLGDHVPDIPVLAGGGGFTISPEAMLKELGLWYGIYGEGELPMLKFLKAWPDEDLVQNIPGLVWQDKSGVVRKNPRTSYAFSPHIPLHRDPKFRYAFETAALPVQLKRGCNQGCSFCVEPLLEGRTFLHRDVEEVLDEIQSLADCYPDVRKIFFIDTEFNIPDLTYPLRLLQGMFNSGLHEHFRFASQFLPRPFTPELADLLAKAGFSLVFTCDSFVDSVLRRNGMSYRQKDILQTLDLCAEYGLDHTVDLIFGLPGESWKSLDQTLELMQRYAPSPWRRYEYTIGARIYHNTPLSRVLTRPGETVHIHGRRTPGMLEPCFYCSPEPPLTLKKYIDAALPFALEFRNSCDARQQQRLGVCWLTDQKRWEEVADMFFRLDLASQAEVYAYVFRSLIRDNEIDMARSLLEYIRAEMTEDGGYVQALVMVRYYLGLLDQG